ncbi:unnamed protein product [Adineta ricciae]|uniref:Iron-binding zinc finger CDGSH type domain-containing protein n=1 Tax=Adineta ricciae TaxID=249248 RepID=A0A815KRF5_ADIRI|nr:unnamed protein product [Adineta ricciae]
MFDVLENSFHNISNEPFDLSISNTYIMSADNTSQQINKTIRKDVDKIVDKCDIEDICAQCDAASNKTVSYCRCWKSKKFPFCDGSHNAWNKETGDNVGPLVITKKQA